MKKFILIDQSIKDAGGHHLEYALRVLKAAKNDGFQTVLAVNKSCKDFDSPTIDILDKSFSHGFWENFACERQAPSKLGTSLLRSLVEKKDDFIYEVLFSQLGLAYQLLSKGNTASGLAKKYHLVGKDQKTPLWSIAAGAVFLRLRHWHRRFSSALTPILSGAGKPVRFLARLIKFIGGVALAPAVLLYLILRWKKVSGRFDRFSALFGNECRHLLARINASKGDIVFVPTLGDVELIGIGLCSQEKAISGLDWHLLFRRNLFVGREPTYLNQISSVQKTQIVLAAFKQRFAFGKVSFYTDSDPLTEQYNLLGIYPFHTLPIPLDETLNKTHREMDPITISYIGDARDEKGFQHLAQLVGDIRAAGFTESQVRFRFQSNFNVPLGEAGSRIAKAELSLINNDSVELLEGPFDSDEYTHLVNNSDILLVPYDENNYYARSSGVFAEALAAGVPVIYPAKSWMGSVLLEENITYCKSLESSCPATPWNNFLDLHSTKIRLTVSPSIQSPLVFFRYQLISAQPGCYVRLCFYETSQSQSAKGKREESLEFSGSILVDLRIPSGMVFYNVKKAGNYAIILENCDGLNQDQFSHSPSSFFTNISYRLAGGPGLLPAQSVGYGYESIEDMSSGVIELISHYKSYEERCRTFSAQWAGFHSSSNLVGMLSAAASAQ